MEFLNCRHIIKNLKDGPDLPHIPRIISGENPCFVSPHESWIIPWFETRVANHFLTTMVFHHFLTIYLDLLKGSPKNKTYSP